MDYVTRQFINLIKKFRKDLRKYVANLNSALQKQHEAIRTSTQTRNNEQSPPPVVNAIVNFPPSVEVHQNQSETTHERKYKGRTLLLSRLSLLAIVFYATLVYLQYREMISATGAAQQAVTEARRNRLQADKAFRATVEQFRLDQRAWVSAVGISPPPSIGQPFDVTIRVRNTGKTFAKVFSVVNQVEPVLRGKHPDFSGEIGPEPKSISVLAPNSDYVITAHVPITTPSGIVPTVTDDRLRDLKKELGDGELRIVVHGRITYLDVFGCSHWTTYCFELQPSWEYAGCSTHSDSDDNQCQKP